MQAPSVSPGVRDFAPHGCVLITRVSGEHPRFQLSLFPARPRLELASAPLAWRLARQFAAVDRVGVWFTTDGVTFSPAPPEPPSFADPHA